MRFTPRTTSFPLELPPVRSEVPSVLAFGMVKGGSTLLFRLLHRLGRHVGLTYFSIDDLLFAKGVAADRRPVSVGPVFRGRGYVYGGFRQFPAYPVPLLNHSRVVLLVRDPRDMITSLYFSLRYSHVLPDAETASELRAEMQASRDALAHMPIGAFALDAIRVYARVFESYVAQGFAWRPNVAIYRYEDVIFRKREWVRDLCEWYGWDIPEAQRNAAADKFDELPDQERPESHVRQVRPGNHRLHLPPTIQQQIAESLGEYMALFGYE